MASKYCKIRARLAGNSAGSEHDYYVSPDSVSLLVDAGKETGLWTSGLSLVVAEPVAALIARLEQP
jgi:hypothetical protein